MSSRTWAYLLRVIAVPALIVAGLGFVIGALLAWGYYASIGDIAEAVGHKLSDDQNDQQ